MKDFKVTGILASNNLRLTGNLETKVPNVSGDFRLREGSIESRQVTMEKINADLRFSSDRESSIQGEVSARIVKAGEYLTGRPVDTKLSTSIEGSQRQMKTTSFLSRSPLEIRLDGGRKVSWVLFLLDTLPLTIYIFNLSPKPVLIIQRRSVIPLFRRIGAVLLLLMLFLAGNTVYAQETDPKAPDSNISERINFIQTSFDKGETRAKAWSYTWTGVYGALTGYQTFQALRTRHDRTSNIVGASQSLLGLAVLMVDPFHASSSASDLRKISGGTAEEQQHKLDMAERWLERNYKQEKLGRSWPNHIIALAVTIIGGGIIWHNNGTKDGMTSILVGIAASEVQIWTQPTRGSNDYNEYRRKYKDAYHGVPEKKYFITPSLNGFVAGVYF